MKTMKKHENSNLPKKTHENRDFGQICQNFFKCTKTVYNHILSCLVALGTKIIIFDRYYVQIQNINMTKTIVNPFSKSNDNITRPMRYSLIKCSS